MGCAPFGYLYIYFLFMIDQGLGTWINSGMALTRFPSGFGWDQARTHNLSIVTLICYPLNRTFEHLEVLSNETFWGFQIFEFLKNEVQSKALIHSVDSSFILKLFKDLEFCNCFRLDQHILRVKISNSEIWKFENEVF